MMDGLLFFSANAPLRLLRPLLPLRSQPTFFLLPTLQGLTVRLEEGRIKVARILIDSVIDREGLLQTGDIILQANGKDVKNPEELQKVIEESGEFIVFKIRPNTVEDTAGAQESDLKPVKAGRGKYFVRAMFDYNPEDDNLLPCQDIGLRFKHGDILEVGVDCSGRYCALQQWYQWW